MIILNKKRILFICFILIFSITSISLNQIFFYPEYLQTSSTPISNHTIVLDAGHGFPDGGAIGVDGSVEANINLEIVLKLQKLLETSGSTIVLTRSDENGIYNCDKKTIKSKKISDMENRANIGNNSEAELFISIHMNKTDEEKYNGPQTFYKNNNSESKILAHSIQSNFNSFIKNDNPREIKSISNIYLSKNVNIPLVIIECGFLSNSTENKLLQNSSYQDKIAFCIYCGILDYFNSTN